MSILSELTPETLREPIYLWQIMAMGYFLLGTAFGLGAGWEFTVGWLVCGILSWIFTYKGFPDMWAYSIPMALCYIFVIAGVYVALRIPDIWGHPVMFFFGGASFVLMGAAFLIFIIRSVIKIREEMSMTAKYTPLGIWAIAVTVFFVCSILAGIGWVEWARGVFSTRALYIAAQFGVTYSVFYMFWLPQKQFREVMQTRPSRLGSKLLKRVVPTSTVVRQKKVSKCPMCSDPLVIEQRKCPQCDEVKDFTWCANSEAFIILCPHCGRQTTYSPNCMVCKNPVSMKIRSRCGGSFPVSEWELQSTAE